MLSFKFIYCLKLIIIVSVFFHKDGYCTVYINRLDVVRCTLRTAQDNSSSKIYTLA